MTPYEMGKYAALNELGIYKEAGAWSFLKGLFRKAAPKAESAAAGATKETRIPPGQKAIGPDEVGLGRDVRPPEGDAGSEALRKQMMAREQEATTTATAKAKDEPGLWSKIPWWGKGLGMGAVGYGGYQMLKPREQEPMGMQPYFGPGGGY